MDDLISRQAAIEALRTCYDTEMITMDNGDEYINYGDAVGEIEQLPPIQPKRGKWHYSDGKPARIGMSFGVICDQCGTESEYCTNFCGECGADMRGEPMSDLISRQEAIDALRGYLVEKRCPDDGTLTCRLIENEVINKLPSAEPKRGKWIKTARWGRVYYCNQCRNYLDFDGVNAGRGSTNFCPNCGAKMEVNNESN